jgi:hypothetical protein
MLKHLVRGGGVNPDISVKTALAKPLVDPSNILSYGIK